jgi:DNA-binding transcriptional ArsR family regulator
VVAYDKVLDALGDPTRRSVFERLAVGPTSVGRLADGLPVSRPAVSQHLRVLREAGLVSDRRVGTRRVYAVDPAGIQALRAYWDRFWVQVLDGYRALAEAENNGDRIVINSAMEGDPEDGPLG